MDYISDEQQVEQIKKWWSENGNSIIIGIVLGVGGIVGWRFWGDHQITQSAEASAHFDAMMFAAESNQYEKAEQLANIIVDDYSGTPYLVYSQLTLAKIQFEQKDYDKAALSYQAIINKKPTDSVSFLARIRLADVYIDQKKYDEALKTLSVDHPSSFAAAIEERKGDVYRYQGEKDKARSAYLLAKVANHPAQDIQFLQQKMDELGQ